MYLTKRLQHKATFARLLALFCLLLPNSAVPPQDSDGGPCMLPLEVPALISQENEQISTVIGAKVSRDGEQPTAHQTLLPDGTPPALAASAVKQNEPAITHNDVQGHLQHDTASSGGELLVPRRSATDCCWWSNMQIQKSLRRAQCHAHCVNQSIHTSGVITCRAAEASGRHKPHRWCRQQES